MEMVMARKMENTLGKVVRTTNLETILSRMKSLLDSKVLCLLSSMNKQCKLHRVAESDHFHSQKEHRRLLQQSQQTSEQESERQQIETITEQKQMLIFVEQC